METNEKGAKKSGRSRYWSIMLVGEHGRVIPFRHFKALTVGVGVVLILSMGALILLGGVVTHQRRQIGILEKNLEQMGLQSKKLRDEKDLYLTQLIALQQQTGELPQKEADETPPMIADSQPTEDAKEPPEPEKAAPKTEKAKHEEEVAVQETKPQVKWSADIRDFKVSYDNRQGVLTAQFRVYNTSRPHNRLSGRTVVVFKAGDDPPSNWAIVPAVPLNNEIPVGKKGRFFSIRNYHTENFKTSRRNNSPHYDMAGVYIFTDQDGELIAKKVLPFNVDYSPPEPAKPAIAPPKPEPEEKPAATPQVSPSEKSEPALNAPEAPATPSPDQNNVGSPTTVTSPDGNSGSPVVSPLPPDEQPDAQLDSDDDKPPEPEKSEPISPAPESEPKPAQEGAPQ